MAVTVLFCGLKLPDLVPDANRKRSLIGFGEKLEADLSHLSKPDSQQIGSTPESVTSLYHLQLL